MITNDDFDYGVGSTLFNVNGNDIEFSDITIRNVVFKNHYYKMKIQSDNALPAIFDTKITSTTTCVVNKITL